MSRFSRFDLLKETVSRVFHASSQGRIINFASASCHTLVKLFSQQHTRRGKHSLPGPSGRNILAHAFILNKPRQHSCASHDITLEEEAAAASAAVTIGAGGGTYNMYICIEREREYS